MLQHEALKYVNGSIQEPFASARDGRDFSRDAELPDLLLHRLFVQTNDCCCCCAATGLQGNWEKKCARCGRLGPVEEEASRQRNSGACWSLREKLSNGDLLKFFYTEIHRVVRTSLRSSHTPYLLKNHHAFKRQSGLAEVICVE